MLCKERFTTKTSKYSHTRTFSGFAKFNPFNAIPIKVVRAQKGINQGILFGLNPNWTVLCYQGQSPTPEGT